MKRLLFIALFSGAFVISPACKKVEGPGGSSTIKGKLNIQVFDVGNNLINEYDGQEEDVYLIYGTTDTFYDDDVKTSYDGSFEFNFLQNGTYTVFVYEDCNSCPSGKDIIIHEIEISEKKSVKDLGTINVRKQ